MEEWKKIQSTYQIKEIIGIVCMTIVSVVGIIFECIVSGGKIFIVINNIESFALTVLQIQATGRNTNIYNNNINGWKYF